MNILTCTIVICDLPPILASTYKNDPSLDLHIDDPATASERFLSYFTNNNT